MDYIITFVSGGALSILALQAMLTLIQKFNMYVLPTSVISQIAAQIVLVSVKIGHTNLLTKS